MSIQMEWSYLNYLEQILIQEMKELQVRKQSMYTHMAGFPAIKTLDAFDFQFASGAPKKYIQLLMSLAFIERTENVLLLGPLGTGKTHLAIALGYFSVIFSKSSPTEQLK